jgi:hypothetical protein
MNIQSVKSLNNKEFMISYYGWASGLQAKHCKIIEGTVYTLSSCEGWEPLPEDMSKAIMDYVN